LDLHSDSSISLLELISSSTDVFFEDAPCGYIFTYPDGIFIKANRTFLNWVGLTADEVLGQKKFQQILSIGSKIYYETTYGPLLRMQGHLKEITLDLKTKNGEIPVLISSSNVTDNSGKLLYIKSTLFDITDRRKYERELLVAKRKAEQAAIRAKFLAKAGEKLRINDEINKHLQSIAELAVEELCDAFVVDLLHGGQSNRVAEAHKVIEKSIPPIPFISDALLVENITDTFGTLTTFSEIIYKLEPQSMIVVPIVKADEQIGILSLFLTELGRRFFLEDKNFAIELAFEISSAIERAELHRENEKIATKLKESEEWFSITLQSIGDAVIAINPDKTVSYLNPIAEKFTGWSNEEAQGLPMDQVFHIISEYTGKAAFNPVDTVLKENRIVELANGTALVRRDNSKIIIEDSASPIRGKDNAIKGVVLVFRDITQKYKEEAKKKQMLSALQSEKEVREKFVATLTHDMRSPLTSVKLNMQFLLKKSREQHAITLATRAINGINRVDRMIQDLLDANRLRAGESIPMDKNEMDIVTVALDVISDLTFIHGDRFILESPETLIGTWNADGIRRILENLCNNAIKYGTADAPVDISIVRIENEVHLSVHNDGKPISMDDQLTLFEPYRRVDSDENMIQKGWGLGLTLVKGVTESHQGRIQVFSEFNLGTKFEVILPLVTY
jgi:PAS domain S-box-containing protein